MEGNSNTSPAEEFHTSRRDPTFTRHHRRLTGAVTTDPLHSKKKCIWHGGLCT